MVCNVERVTEAEGTPTKLATATAFSENCYQPELNTCYMLQILRLRCGCQFLWCALSLTSSVSQWEFLEICLLRLFTPWKMSSRAVDSTYVHYTILFCPYTHLQFIQCCRVHAVKSGFPSRTYTKVCSVPIHASHNRGPLRATPT
jgi:hypothetical protein